MSLIIAFKTKDKVYMAADSRKFYGKTYYSDGLLKFYQTDNYMIGIAGFAMYSTTLMEVIKRPEFSNVTNIYEAERLFHAVRDIIIEKFKAKGEEGEDGMPTFTSHIILINNAGQIFKSGPYFEAEEEIRPYFAIGLPSEYALGVMESLVQRGEAFDETLVDLVFNTVSALNIYIGGEIYHSTLDIVGERQQSDS